MSLSEAIAPHPSRSGWINYVVLLPWGVLAIALLITYFLRSQALQDVHQDMQIEFDARTRETISLVEQRMLTYEKVLYGARGLFSASRDVDRDEFHAYVSALNLAETHPGIQGLGYSLIVPLALKDKHIAAVRKQGFPQYTIHPEGERDLYTSVIFIEPFSKENQQVFGYDMYADLEHPLKGDPKPGGRQNAMIMARDSGKTVISSKVRLRSDTENNDYVQAGFLMYLPVYKHGAAIDSVADRRANILGWVYFPFRMDDLMVGILGGVASDVDIEVHDGENVSDESLMYDPDFSSGKSGLASLFHSSQRIEIAGHPWTVTVRSLEGFEMRMNEGKPLFITYAGGVASILLALLAWLTLYGRTRALRDASEIERSETRLATTIDTALDAVVQMDSEGRITGWNAQAETIFGWSRAEAMGRLLHETIIPPKYRESHVRGMAGFLKTGAGPVLNSRIEITALCRNGNEFPIELAITHFKSGSRHLFTSFIRNITQRRLAEEDLRLASMVYENSSEAMVITDSGNLIIAVNPAFEKLTGYAAEEVLGKDPNILTSGRQDEAFYQAMWHELNTVGSWQGELWDKRKNGEIYPKSLTINTIKDSSGQVHRYVALFSDITKKKESEELIWKQANFDMLTGLPNRRMFRDRLDQEIKKAHRSGLPLALMLLDLDHFKEINDTLGHDMGDVLLKEAATRLSDCVRECDTVARLGGDEFTVILGELDDRGSIGRIAYNILQKLAEPFHLGNESGYISTSIGITLYPDDATEIEALLKNADQAMYAAKDQGRNRFSYFTPSMQETAQSRMRLINDLRNAVVSSDQFRLYYQPIVELASGAIHKAEALIRWQHPTNGMVSPADFIPLAEETGMIVEIGDWVFYQAAAQAARWRASRHAEFQISINKSPVQFQNASGGHPKWFEHLRKLGLPGQSITVEITEGLLLDASTSVTNQLLAFRDEGMQVAIDDFGTGYSSLSYLKRFDIDYLKIDQAFVRNLKHNSDDLALCEAIIVMAHRLGIKVIAEGIETAEQRDLLRAAACDYGQGYLFSRPVPADELDAFLDNHAVT